MTPSGGFDEYRITAAPGAGCSVVIPLKSSLPPRFPIHPLKELELTLKQEEETRWPRYTNNQTGIKDRADK